MVLVCVLFVIVRWVRKRWFRDRLVLAFFHPYLDGGGGGERVLWVLIAGLFKEVAVQNRYRVVIYSSKDESQKLAILADVKKRFDLDLLPHAALLTLVKLHSVQLLEARWYKVATMLFQSLGSVVVGVEALLRCPPDVYFDTMGVPFTYPVARWVGGSHVVSYVHYPIISSDMLQRVREQRPAHNNGTAVARSVTISAAKVLYYRWFALVYRCMSIFADTVFVNSSWTEGHISQLWGRPKDDGQRRQRRAVVKLYPPCNTQLLQSIPLRNRSIINPQAADRARVVLSVGQFRPEKDHSLQLRALRALRARGSRYSDVRLVLAGSTRNAEDRALVTALGAEARKLGVTDSVLFVVDASHAELRDWLATAAVGLHTMWNEHFGISIVEMMAAGLVVVAHNSGGPRMDIVNADTIPSTNPNATGACVASRLAHLTSPQKHMPSLISTTVSRFPSISPQATWPRHRNSTPRAWARPWTATATTPTAPWHCASVLAGPLRRTRTRTFKPPRCAFCCRC